MFHRSVSLLWGLIELELEFGKEGSAYEHSDNQSFDADFRDGWAGPEIGSDFGGEGMAG